MWLVTIYENLTNRDIPSSQRGLKHFVPQMMPGIRPLRTFLYYANYQIKLQPLTLLRALSEFIIRKMRKNKRKAIFSENISHLDDTSPFSGNIYPPLVI